MLNFDSRPQIPPKKRILYRSEFHQTRIGRFVAAPINEARTAHNQLERTHANPSTVTLSLRRTEWVKTFGETIDYILNSFYFKGSHGFCLVSVCRG